MSKKTGYYIYNQEREMYFLAPGKDMTERKRDAHVYSEEEARRLCSDYPTLAKIPVEKKKAMKKIKKSSETREYVVKGCEGGYYRAPGLGTTEDPTKAYLYTRRGARDVIRKYKDTDSTIHHISKVPGLRPVRAEKVKTAKGSKPKAGARYIIYNPSMALYRLEPYMGATYDRREAHRFTLEQCIHHYDYAGLLESGYFIYQIPKAGGRLVRYVHDQGKTKDGKTHNVCGFVLFHPASGFYVSSTGSATEVSQAAVLSYEEALAECIKSNKVGNLTFMAPVCKKMTTVETLSFDIEEK